LVKTWLTGYIRKKIWSYGNGLQGRAQYRRTRQHRLARFSATYRALLNSGNTPLEVQQKRMRHANIRTTTQYGGVPVVDKRTANRQVVRAILMRKPES